ncbi:MAG: hypothetical protein M3157_00610 [Actinomycetota bacterium]|nr:hypothetical protein [Actinomycetota bacterium]
MMVKSAATRGAAMLLGVIPAFVLLLTVFSDTPELSPFTSFVLYVLGRIGIVAALYAAFGVAFGLAFPRLAWRWGLWLYIPTFFLLISFLLIIVGKTVVGDVSFGSTQDLVETLLLFSFFAGALVAACLGAYAGAWIRHYFSSE